MPPITESFAARPTLVVRTVARADEPEPSSAVLMLLKRAATPLVFRRGRGLVRIAASAHPGGVWLEAVPLTPMALVGCIMPTLARVVDESGVPGFEMWAWAAVYAPAGTPKPIVDRLSALVREAAKSTNYRNLIQTTRGVSFAGTPEELAAFQASETKKWGEIVAIAGMKEP